MRDPTWFHRRVYELGHEIFELADAARPRIWQHAWWLERMVQWVDQDPLLRTRAFEFVECLPSLNSDKHIVEHLAAYLGDPNLRIPKIGQALLQPGALRDACTPLMAKATQFGARNMAGRYITGYDVPSLIKTLERLRREGMGFTLDVLGEFTTSHVQADRYADRYHDLIDQLIPILRDWSEVPLLDRDTVGTIPRLNMSVKLTSLDPHFDAIAPDRAIEAVGQRLRPLLRHARDNGAFINIDMESFKYRDITLELFTRILMEKEFRDWRDVGIVVQAYLVDGEKDLQRLLDFADKRGTPFAIRLVKGAYWDAETAAAVRAYVEPPVWQNKWETDACYERMTRTMFDHRHLIRPCFASHNVRSLAVVLATAELFDVSKYDYEVQMLYGMGDPLKSAMVQLDRSLRIYCPYGDLMPGMGYLIRRLLENTSNEGFLKQTFGDHRSRDRLLANPAVTRPPSAPLPERDYRNTDPEEPMSDFKNAANTNFTRAENREKMLGALQYVRGEFGRSWPLIIDGETQNGEAQFETVNPSCHQEVVGRVALATTQDADRAVAAARRAFPQWRRTPAKERARLLDAAADRLEKRRFELAATMVLEVGKPWREADADVTEAIDHCRYYADQIVRIESRPRVRNIPGENNKLVYSPKGICAVISPWAFPLAISTGMISAALAAGNTVVFKPARQASVLAAKLVEILHNAGFPPGAVNLLPGAGETVGAHLVTHPDVNIVSFTGSSAVGETVLENGSNVTPNQPFIRKMIVEMGGKNAIIVDDDADLDGAIQGVIESAFGFAGQKCSSCGRVIVLDGAFEAFTQRLREAVESLVVGPADDPTTMVGPVMDEAARERLLGHKKLGHAEGRLLVEAKLPDHCEGGFFIAPAVYVDIAPDARLAQEELFGPVLPILRAADFEEALRIANGTRYALTGGLYSRHPGHIERATRDFAVGNLYINRRITGSQVDAQPFGGFKLSGTGVKAGSPDYLLHYMDARCITENTQRSGLVPDERLEEMSEGPR